MKKIFIAMLLISFGLSQNIESFFKDDTKDILSKTEQNVQKLDLTDLENLSYTPVEKAIDPDSYILGPGDLLGISIISVTNVSLPIRINPVGEIMIPSVGVINVNGIPLTNAKNKIAEMVHDKALPNALVEVTLLDLKRFKVQILGAVNNPGYVYASPVDGVYEIIMNSGGVQKFADPNKINIIRDETTIEVNLTGYLSGQNSIQNELLKASDIIYVPFNDYAKSNNFMDSSYNNNQVIVYGFISRTNSGNVFRYFPGYKVRDYIALAGGTVSANSSFPIGSMKRAKIYRADGTKISNALNETVLPGDIIEVPPKFASQLLGNQGIISAFAAIIASSYMVYKYIDDQNK